MYTDGELGERSFQRCPECPKTTKDFKTSTDFYWHVESCVRYAFENEVVNAFNDFRVVPSTTRLQVAEPVPGIIAKASSQPAQRTVIRVAFGPSQGKLPTPDENQISQPSTSREIHRKPHSTVNHQKDEVSSFGETITGPGGLQLMVTVEQPLPLDPPQKNNSTLRRDKDRLNMKGLRGESSDEDEDLEDSPPDMDYGGGLLEEHFEGNPDEPLDQNEPDDIDFDTMGNQYPTSYPKVIGALANANDDPSRLKMECPACGLRLYRHNYSTHYRVHTGELPFPCHYCDKRFRTTSARRVHERAHTGEKPYVCPSCNYAAMTKRNLDRHVYNNHIRDGQRRGPRNRRSKYRDLPPPEMLYHPIEKEVVIEDEDGVEARVWCTNGDDLKQISNILSGDAPLQLHSRDDHAYGRL